MKQEREIEHSSGVARTMKDPGRRFIYTSVVKRVPRN